MAVEYGSGLGTDFPNDYDVDNIPEQNSPNPGKTKPRAELFFDTFAMISALQHNIGLNAQGSKANIGEFLALEHNANGTHKSASNTKANLPSVVTYNDAQNIFLESQRVEKATAPAWELRRTGIAIDAGGLWRLVIDGAGNILLQCNTAVAGDFSSASAFTISTAMMLISGIIPLARMAFMTTLTFTSIASGGQSTQDVIHGLGTDNVAIILMLDDNAVFSIGVASQRPDGFGAVISNGGANFPNVSVPASGRVQVGVYNNGGLTQTIRVRVYILRE